MTFLKSAYKCCCKAITSLFLQSGSVIIVRRSRRAVRNVGIDVLCRFPRTVGREGNSFMFSSLSIRPSFPPRAPRRFSVCSSAHRVDEGSSCSRSLATGLHFRLALYVLLRFDDRESMAESLVLDDRSVAHTLVFAEEAIGKRATFRPDLKRAVRETRRDRRTCHQDLPRARSAPG